MDVLKIRKLLDKWPTEFQIEFQASIIYEAMRIKNPQLKTHKL